MTSLLLAAAGYGQDGPEKAALLKKWPVQGVTGFVDSLNLGLQKRALEGPSWEGVDWGSLQDSGLRFEEIQVQADGKIAITGINRPRERGRKLLQDITQFLETLQRSSLREVRLERITWEPFRDETVAAFTITAVAGSRQP